MSTDLDPQRLLIRQLLELGRIELTQSNYELAAQYFQETYELSCTIQAREFITESLIQKANVCKHRGQYREAVALFQQAYDLTVELQNHKRRASVLSNIATLYVLRH